MATSGNPPIQGGDNKNGKDDNQKKIMTGQDKDQTSVDVNNPNKTMGSKRPNQPNEDNNEEKNPVFSTSAGSSLINVSLIVSNVRYLKILLDDAKNNATHYIELVLICASLLLQLIIGFLVIISYNKNKTRYRMKDSTEHSPLVPPQTSQISKLKRLVACLGFLVLFINIVIAVLGFE